MLIELLEVGRKVSKTRLDRIKAAMKSLQEIVAEADDTDQPASEKAEAFLGAMFAEASAVVKKGEKYFLYDDGVKKGEFDDEGKATAALKKLRSQSDAGPKEESFEMDVDVTQPLVMLEEKAVRKDGTIPILIASEGWGSNGYYSREVLERDGPTVWPKGTHMYWDHPTETERRERPERSLKDLAAVTETAPVWKDNGPEGPGLYSEAKVRSEFQPAVDELAPHMGVSLRAFGSTKFGEKEGRKGPIVEKLVPTPHNSIDFVTLPGRGGKVVSLFESARGGGFKSSHEPEDHNVPNGTELQEANTKIRRLEERWLLREARDYVQESLRGVRLPDITKSRLVESLAFNPPVKDDALDKEAFEKRIDQAVKDEAQYLATAAGVGEPRGMGLSESLSDSGPHDMKPEDFDKEFTEAMSAWGGGEKITKQAVAGRGN